MQRSLLYLVCALATLGAPAAAQDLAGEYRLWTNDRSRASTAHLAIGRDVDGVRWLVVRSSWTSPDFAMSVHASSAGLEVELPAAVRRGAAGAVAGASGGEQRAQRFRYAVSPDGMRIREDFRDEHGVTHTAFGVRVDEQHVLTDQHVRLVSNGPGATRYDLVLLADGYTPEQTAELRQTVAAIVTALRSTEPFSSYWRYLNVHLVETTLPGASVADGRTRFDVRLRRPRGKSYLKPSLDVPAALRVARAHVPGVDATVLLVNAEFRSFARDGRRFATVSAVDAEVEAVTLHELGHVIARLADEYVEEDKRCSISCEPEVIDRQQRRGLDLNVTSHVEREQIPWKHWIAPSTSLPTPPGDAVPAGLFSGGHYREALYRPAELCRMRHHAVSRYCVVCKEQLILALSARVQPVQVRARRVDADTWALMADVDGPPVNGTVRWVLEERTIGYGNHLRLGRAAVTLGSSRLTCVVTDPTLDVRVRPVEHEVELEVLKRVAGQQQFEVRPRR